MHMVLGHAVAILSVAIALGIALLLDAYLVTAPASLFLCAIMFSTWWSGARAGLLAMALSLLCFDYYFVESVYSWSIEFSKIPRVIIFLMSGIFVWLLSSTQRSAVESLGYARDSLAKSVQELGRINAALQVENAERKRAEEVMGKQARLLDLSHDTIFVRDMKDVITYWNLGAAELYGWQSDQAIGKVSHQLMETVFPAPLEEINAQLLRTGRWEGELVHARRHGPALVVASRWSLQRDESGHPVAILETNNDITDRKRVEDALRRSQAYLTEAQRLSHTGSWAFDVVSRRGLHSSAEHHRLFGFDPSEDMPPWEAWRQRIHPDDRDRTAGTIEQCIRERTDFEMDYRTLHPDGTIRYAHVVGHPVFSQSGNLAEFVGTSVDVTGRKRAQEALRQSQSELAHATRVTTLGELAASIAHEVNQPLAAIVTNGEVCLRWLDRDVPDLAEAREAVGDIISNGRRASEIIQRLRALSRKTETQKVALNINDAISEVIPLVQHDVLSQRVSLRLELASDLPAVLGDRVQLQQVIINLVLNGMEAMEAVTDRPRQLVVRTQPDDEGQVLVLVEDAGVGIDPENATRLFNAFFTTKSAGMGMGLSICRSIIENHDGRLWASRNAGPGATFQFALQPHHDLRS